MDGSAVRQFVVEMVSQLGLSTEPRGEAILLQHGYYYGRRYQFAEVTAVWSAPDRRLTIFAVDGTQIRSICTDESESCRQAA